MSEAMNITAGPCALAGFYSPELQDEFLVVYEQALKVEGLANEIALLRKL